MQNKKQESKTFSIYVVLLRAFTVMFIVWLIQTIFKTSLLSISFSFVAFFKLFIAFLVQAIIAYLFSITLAAIGMKVIDGDNFKSVMSFLTLMAAGNFILTFFVLKLMLGLVAISYLNVWVLMWLIVMTVNFSITFNCNRS